MDDYISKPVRMEELERVLREVYSFLAAQTFTSGTRKANVELPFRLTNLMDLEMK